MSFICLSCKESIRPTRKKENGKHEQQWEEGRNWYFQFYDSPSKSVRVLEIVNLSGVKFLWVSVMRFACANTNYTRLYLNLFSSLNIVFIIFAYPFAIFYIQSTPVYFNEIISSTSIQPPSELRLIMMCICICSLTTIFHFVILTLEIK